jgi:hypothetical protein
MHFKLFEEYNHGTFEEICKKIAQLFELPLGNVIQFGEVEEKMSYFLRNTKFKGGKCKIFTDSTGNEGVIFDKYKISVEYRSENKATRIFFRNVVDNSTLPISFSSPLAVYNCMEYWNVHDKLSYNAKEALEETFDEPKTWKEIVMMNIKDGHITDNKDLEILGIDTYKYRGTIQGGKFNV